MAYTRIISTRNTGLQKNFMIFLYCFIASVWLVLFAKFIFHTGGNDASLRLVEIVQNLLLAAVFPIVLLYFHSQFKNYMATQEEEYKELFKKNPHAMWVYDMDTLKFLMVNDAAIALYGYDAGEFLKMTITEIRPYEDVPAVLEDVEKSKSDFDTAYYHSGIWRHKKKNGELIYTEVSSHKIIFNGKKASLVLSYDVTGKVMQELKLQTLNQSLEQKVRERTNDLLLLNKTLIEQNKTIKTVNHNLANLGEELKAANGKIQEHADLKSRFVSMVSHEFRTPLATIRFAAEFVERYHARISSAQLLEKVGSITKQVIHMDAMLNDVLTIGKNESDKIKPVVDTLDLLAFIHGIVKEVLEATHHSHEIVLDLTELPDKVCSDEKLLRNIFINLLNNAVKYSPDSRKVYFNVFTQHDDLVFMIRDEGIGIAHDDISKIFDPFYRTVDVKHIQGTGLGLSIVKRAVELIGGTINVESTVGEGSSFTINLPLRQMSERSLI